MILDPFDLRNPHRYQLVVYPKGLLAGPCHVVGKPFNSSSLCEEYVQALEAFFRTNNLPYTAWLNPERKNQIQMSKVPDLELEHLKISIDQRMDTGTIIVVSQRGSSTEEFVFSLSDFPFEMRTAVHPHWLSFAVRMRALREQLASGGEAP